MLSPFSEPQNSGGAPPATQCLRHWHHLNDHQIELTEDRAKHWFWKEWTLVCNCIILVIFYNTMSSKHFGFDFIYIIHTEKQVSITLDKQKIVLPFLSSEYRVIWLSLICVSNQNSRSTEMRPRLQKISLLLKELFWIYKFSTFVKLSRQAINL